ncbi:UDP-N-acetylmuramoyl-L-alanine--D-glutamate ligase [Periweissella fabalis]|uniref:UDP-N-acetylmuramoylalanine--D-glutamate ligase n=1 Tax=Periweissella fabalis TaxID=1070421 RepID=A0A7X6N440_9LACO|nr:UDP-N-acetylmuramoyl-L-alanine--D-glutamate ligase [Periweissella fabalis]MCM0598481.1 UDP-N-acetylmuramoyl-L-alanine--D-glutamate ligase [Periweissella fabalis]NKZ24239.1 UDP-N-acetylmuramoyl-L-alanine--D-glutamate ligase [Periweissella fabalis]
MEKITQYQNKRVLILGFAKSGASAAEVLIHLGAKVTVTDTKDLTDDVAALKLKKIGVEFTQNQSAEVVNEFDILVKNPGIPYTNPVVVAAQAKNMLVISEIELAGQVFSGELIAITGSNGKTTTTTMVTKLLASEREAGVALYAGNIGIAASTRAMTLSKDDTLVIESSSFQLMGTNEFHPHIAVLTNIFASHLDYHGTRKNYIAAKMKITANQNQDDFFVVNYDYEELALLAQSSRAQIIPFSRLGKSKLGAYVENDKMYWQDEYIMDVNEMGVPGDHNVENALAAIAVAKLHGRSTKMIAEILKTFSGVRHRTQFVLEADGRKFYNDSKATDIEATQMALAGFSNPVVLIAGGLDRGDTYERLEADLGKHVRAVVASGQTKDIFAQSAKAAGVEKVVFAKDVVEAVPMAWELSEPGDIILLSPAAASWDQYPSFETRGELFIEAVEKLTNKEEI